MSKSATPHPPKSSYIVSGTVYLSASDRHDARRCAKNISLIGTGIAVFEVAFLVLWVAFAFGSLYLPEEGEFVEAHLVANYKLYFHVLGIVAFFYLYAGVGGAFGIPSVFGMFAVFVLDTYTLIEFWRFLHNSPHGTVFWTQFSLAIFAEFLSLVQLSWVITEYWHHKLTGVRFDLLHDEPAADVLAVDAKVD